MITLGYTPTRVYSVAKRHWRQTSTNPVPPRERVVEKHHDEIQLLNKEITECKRINSNLIMIAKWNVRASQSAFKTSQEILEILEDMSTE